jgi:hypothetical protein
MAVDADWISRYRAATTAWLTALEDLNALREQYDALDYGSTLPPEAFEGANSDITPADLVAAVGSVESLNTTFESGHNTNLYKLKT